VYLGMDGQAGESWNCIEYANPDVTTRHLDQPPAGQVFYFLVSAANTCGEGSLGLGRHASPACPLAQSDSDGDDVWDLEDNCPLVHDPSAVDCDRDFVGDACDNCPATGNPPQADSDFDGRGDVCENDADLEFYSAQTTTQVTDSVIGGWTTALSLDVDRSAETTSKEFLILGSMALAGDSHGNNGSQMWYRLHDGTHNLDSNKDLLTANGQQPKFIGLSGTDDDEKGSPLFFMRKVDLAAAVHTFTLDFDLGDDENDTAKMNTASLVALELPPGYEWTSLEGRHMGADNASVMLDQDQSWTDDELVYEARNGANIYNLTDGSRCHVTANTQSTVSCALIGGTDNDWDAGDRYTLQWCDDDYADLDEQTVLSLNLDPDTPTDYLIVFQGTTYHDDQFEPDEGTRFYENGNLLFEEYRPALDSSSTGNGMPYTVGSVYFKTISSSTDFVWTIEGDFADESCVQRAAILAIPYGPGQAITTTFAESSTSTDSTQDWADSSCVLSEPVCGGDHLMLAGVYGGTALGDEALDWRTVFGSVTHTYFAWEDANVNTPSRHIYASVHGQTLESGMTRMEIEHHRSHGGDDSTQLEKCHLWVGRIP
jgi:hypothetical protein